MPKKHSKKRNHSKKESLIEGFKKLEITVKKEPKAIIFLDKNEDIRKNRYLKRCASENSLKINSESMTHLSSRSEPSLLETFKFTGKIPRRRNKKLRFSHEVVVMCYHNDKPTIRHIQPLADERDQQKRSYKNRMFGRPLNTVFWPNE